MKNTLNSDISTNNNITTITKVILLGVLLFIFPAIRPVGIDRDSKAYENDAEIAISNNFNHVVTGSREPTFFLIVFIAKLLFPDPVRGMFVIYALISVTIKIYAIYKYSSDFILSSLIYISFFYFLHEFTTIRAGVASGIFLLAFDDIKNKNLRNYLIKIFIATLFHYSAIILIVFYFVNNKFISKNLNLLIILAIAFDITKMNIVILSVIAKVAPAFIGVKLNVYINLLKTGRYSSVSTQRLLFNYLFLAIIFICNCLPILKNDKKLNYILDVFKFSVAFFFATKCIPVLGARISEMTSIYLVLLIPEIIKNFRKSEQDLIIIMTILLLLPIMLLYIKVYYPFYNFL